MNPSDKKQQRAELRRIARLNDGVDPAPVVDRLVERLEQLSSAQIVAAYMALPGEVNLSGLFDRMNKNWVFPKVVGDELKFYRVRNLSQDLQAGAYGIPEPKEGLEEVAVSEIDVFLCPGLGFDCKGGRMGRGKGFYDRILKSAKPEALKIGVCFPFQIRDEIIMEDWDVRMDEVVYR